MSMNRYIKQSPEINHSTYMYIDKGFVYINMHASVSLSITIEKYKSNCSGDGNTISHTAFELLAVITNL